MTEYERWLSVELDDPDLKEELLSVKDQPEEINDRFYRDLAFGTGGLRGVIGAGTNRMNVYTVRKATQGLANYLNKHNTEGKPLSVAIANDSRNKGVLFSKESAAVRFNTLHYFISTVFYSIKLYFLVRFLVKYI